MKYKLTDETREWFGRILHRIEALKDFGSVKAGDKGGWIEKEDNLSQEGDCWVADEAWVYGNARVYGDARVFGNACVFVNARVYGDACVCGNACVYDNACVFVNARVYGNAHVYGDARVYGDACVCGNARVCDKADIKSKDDIIWLTGIGSENRTTTLFRTKEGGILVSCGCFSGDLAEFEEKVKETHGENKYAREYLALIGLAKIHFDLDKEDV